VANRKAGESALRLPLLVPEKKNQQCPHDGLMFDSSHNLGYGAVLVGQLKAVQERL
jgi:hypothetical protein